MARTSPLTLSFLEKRPLSAARTLSTLPAADAAAFLETVPTRYAVSALGRMGDWAVASVMSAMEEPCAVAALREMKAIAAAATLRLLQKEKREALMTQLPNRLRRELESALSFPEDTVGAHMSASVATFQTTDEAGPALDIIRRSADDELDAVFLIDDERMLLGAVTLARILSAAPTRQLQDIADTGIRGIPSRSRIEAIRSRRAWDKYANLPVVNRQKQLIGSLPRKAAMRHGRSGSHSDTSGSNSIIGAVASAFFASAMGLGQILASADQQPYKAEEDQK